MKNRYKSIPVAMLTKKFYCCRCGALLMRNPRTRTVKKGDAEYGEYNRIGKTRIIGDVDVTEYDFLCVPCDKITTFDEQCVIENIQKIVDKRVLSDAEITEYSEKAQANLKRKRRITSLFVTIFFILLLAFSVYMALKTQGFSLKFYL